MAYTEPTLAEARTALASRLNDPGMIRWVSAELNGYLREALRTWGSWTSHWRDRDSFTTTLAEPFYDLPTVIPALRQQTVTNWDLVTDIEYALLEPPTPSAWSGTDQFTLEQISAAIQRRRDLFLQETGAVLTRSETLYASPPTNGRLPLSESVLTVRRAAWRPTATQFLRPLIRTDEWGATNFSPAWPQSTQQPGAYSTSVTPPLTLQTIPAPPSPGTLDLVAIERGATLVLAASSSLGVPNDWAWVIKWGALADLLHGDGLALDPGRASYCEQRWQQGIDAAKIANVVLAARINDVTCRIGSLADADSYSPTWQLLPGVPKRLLLAGQTMVASWPPPGAAGGQWTITLDVVRNAPIPTVDADVLQVGADLYDTILDYAQHLGLFKEGVGQLELSQALLERVVTVAGINLTIQQASQPSRSQLLGQSRTDEHASPRELDTVGVV